MSMRLPKAKPPVPPERDVQRACLDLLHLMGCPTVRVNGGMMPTKSGGRVRFNIASVGNCSDILAVLPDGRMGAIECKREGGKLTEGQRAWLDAVSASGGVALVVSSMQALAAALLSEGYDTRGVG